MLKFNFLSLKTPMQFNVSSRGAIKKVTALVDADRKLVSQAKRVLRQYSFRPAIIDGVLCASEDYVQTVAVSIN